MTIFGVITFFIIMVVLITGWAVVWFVRTNRKEQRLKLVRAHKLAEMDKIVVASKELAEIVRLEALR